MSPSARPARTARREADEAPSTLSRRALRALDGAGVSWCLLRDEDPSDTRGDVDVLVDARDLPAARRALRPLGFLERRAPGYEPHVFFLALDRDGVTKLDVVDDLRFGPSGYRAVGLSDALGRRVRRDDVWRLDPADEFWALLFHAALDKPAIDERHRDRLRRLRSDASRSPAAEAGLLEAVASERWDVAVLRARALAGPASAGAAAIRRARMLIGWRMRPLSRPGITAAVMGPDGAGKSTMAALVAEGFPIPVRTIYMGLYKTARRTPPGVGLAARLALQRARYALAAYHRARGRVVLFDRYADDATLEAPTGRRDRLRRRLLAGAVPRPDVVLVLDAPADVLLARKGEHTRERLERDRARYRSAAQRATRGVILDATQPAETVAREAAAEIWRALVERG